jgi:hypothetical protein
MVLTKHRNILTEIGRRTYRFRVYRYDKRMEGWKDGRNVGQIMNQRLQRIFIVMKESVN